MSEYAGIVQDELRDLRGNAMQGAVVRVYNVGTTTPATLYDNAVRIADATGGDSLVNDATTGLPAAAGLLQPGVDANGNYTFFADSDVAYDMRVDWQGLTFNYRVQPKVVEASAGGVTSVNGQTGAVDLSGTYAGVPTPGTAGTALTTGGVAQTVTKLVTHEGKVRHKSGYPWVDVESYGADETGAVDSTAAINAAVTTGRRCRATGLYRVDGTVVLNTNSKLTLVDGAELRRKAAAASTEAIVQVRGNFATLLGAGLLVTEKASPGGILHVGPETPEAPTASNWPRMEALRLEGLKAVGNVGILLDSNEGGVGGNNYTFRANDVELRNLGTAIRSTAGANAYQFYGTNWYNILTYCIEDLGGIENQFHGGFVHFSADVTVVKLVGALYCIVDGIIAEPGGTVSKFYDVDATSVGCEVSGAGNVTGANVNLSPSTYVGDVVGGYKYPRLAVGLLTGMGSIPAGTVYDAAAGAGADIDVTGTDLSGTVTVTTGAGTAPGFLASILRGGPPGAVVIQPMNANTEALKLTYQLIGSEVYFHTAVAPADATPYQWSYLAV